MAEYIKADTVAANYATISSLNAATARIDTIEARYITASDITVGNLKTGSVNGHDVKWQTINYVEQISVSKSDGVVTNVSSTTRTMYTLIELNV